jgi:O-antigen/teichoic acid export membrane protein
MIIIIGSMVFGSILETEFSIYQFIYGQCVAYLIASIVVLILLVIRIKKFSFSFKRAEIAYTFKSSLPFALLTFLMLIYFKIDAVMIERMLPDGDLQTGYYAQAYKLLDALVMFALLFSTLLLPMFSNMISQNESVISLVKLSFKLMLIPSVIGVVMLCSVGDELLPLMFETGSAYSSEIFPYLILTLIPLGASYVFGTLITAEGDMRFLNKIALLAILVNVVMNGILIGEYGIMGAAVATLVTQTLVSLIQWRSAAVKFKISYELAHLIRGTVFLIGLVMTSFLMRYIDTDWRVEALVLITVGVILTLSLRLIKKSDFTALKNYQKS